MLDIYIKKDKNIINIYTEKNINLERAINIAENEYNLLNNQNNFHKNRGIEPF